MSRIVCIILFLGVIFTGRAQINQVQTGAWYMYFWNTTVKDGPIGFQGDIQARNWNVAGDLEQLMLRGGITYSPADFGVKFTAGYANITTGAFGDDNSTTNESRIYQEALIPQKLGNRVYLTHRFRYEQRILKDQDLRTRYRYNLFMNIPFNQTDLKQGAIYLALYNELFVNGQRDTGIGSVELFDRNRAYAALGYSIKDNLRVQLGWMHQQTNSWRKDQLQVSAHHKF